MKTRRGTNTNRNNIGIHLYDPTKRQIEDAKEDAESKDFPAVYIHRTRIVVVDKPKR